MKELLDLIKAKLVVEAQKDTINTSLITELAEAYRRFRAIGETEVPAPPYR